jgi:hypothetical protein
MSLTSIVEARIHPAIGVARVGNAPGKNDFFIGPEVPNAVPAPAGGYRDAQGRLKRQAARFRIYGYDKQGSVVGELTDDVAEIEWHVHVANKKASWYNFDATLDLPEAASVRSPRRNAQIQGANRTSLSIDPGPRVVNRRRKRASFDTGKFFGKQVYLGEIQYSHKGRLLFLGGHGKSAPISPTYTITTFGNNAGWHDDISDGPVSAKLRIGDRDIPVDAAWVVTAPPNYAPDLVATQTLYDVILDALHPMVSPAATPSFTQHILPIFRQFQDSQWVNAGFAAQFGFHGLVDFMRPDFIQNLATAPVPRPNGTFDPFQELRFQIFNAFRNPAFQTFDPVGWPPLYGDASGNFDHPVSPRVGFAITQQSYNYLQSWMQGNFVADYNPASQPPQSITNLPLQQQPDTLDHAALHFCLGGPFHPGVEMTWIMRQFLMYRAKFRLRQRLAGIPEPDYGDFMTRELATANGGPLSASGPGDLTKWMGLPWQGDTAGCGAGGASDFPQNDAFLPAFWPSRVPNTVLSNESYQVVIDTTAPLSERQAAFAHREQWAAPTNLNAPILFQVETLIDRFDALGIIERREKDLGTDFPEAMYVQTLPPGSPPATGQAPVSTHPNLMRDIMEFRLGHVR